jgi:hypothetical protein
MRFATLYIPDFPVWAVRFFEPGLREHEVLVQLSGKVVARSDRLRAEGIERGQAIDRARAHAPDAMVRAHPGVRVRLAWEIVLRWLNTLTPWLETSVSGAFVYRPTDRTLRSEVDALANEGVAVMTLVGDVDPHDVARRLHARVGVADDRATSLLAALSAERSSARVVMSGQEQALREQLAIGWLEGAGISAETRERLAWLGFHSIASIGRLSAAQILAQFTEGRALIALTRGGDVRPVLLFNPPPSIRGEHVALNALREPAEWEPVVRRLLLDALGRLGERDAQMLTVSMSAGRVTRTSRRLCHEPTSDVRTLGFIAELALADVTRGLEACPSALENGVDEVVVVLEGLVASAGQQQRLWEEERDIFEKALTHVEKRLPGLSLRIIGVDSDSYLPEEAFQLVSAALPLPPIARKRTARRRSRPRQHPLAEDAARPQGTDRSTGAQGTREATKKLPGSEPASGEVDRAREDSVPAAGWETRVTASAAPVLVGPHPTRIKRPSKRSSAGHIRHDGFQLEEPGLLR